MVARIQNRSRMGPEGDYHAAATGLPRIVGKLAQHLAVPAVHTVERANGDNRFADIQIIDAVANLHLLKKAVYESLSITVQKYLFGINQTQFYLVS